MEYRLKIVYPICQKLMKNRLMCEAFMSNENYQEQMKIIEYYKNVTSVDPKIFYAWCEMSLAYNTLGELNKAKDCLQKALKLNPELAMAWYHMGTSSKYPTKMEKERVIRKLLRTVK